MYIHIRVRIWVIGSAQIIWHSDKIWQQNSFKQIIVVYMYVFKIINCICGSPNPQINAVISPIINCIFKLKQMQIMSVTFFVANRLRMLPDDIEEIA